MKQGEQRWRVCAGPQIGSAEPWGSVAQRLAENQQSRKQHQAGSDAGWKKRKTYEASKQRRGQNWKQTWGWVLRPGEKADTKVENWLCNTTEEKRCQLNGSATQETQETFLGFI